MLLNPLSPSCSNGESEMESVARSSICITNMVLIAFSDTFAAATFFSNSMHTCGDQPVIFIGDVDGSKSWVVSVYLLM